MYLIFLTAFLAGAPQELATSFTPGQIVVTKESTPITNSGQVVANLDAGNSITVQEMGKDGLSIYVGMQGTIPLSNVISIDQAESYFEQQVRKSSAKPAIVLALARVEYATGKHTEAMQHFDAVLKVEPTNIACLLARGIASLKSGNHSHAKQDFDRAIAIAPQSLDAYRWRAAAHIAVGNYDAALDDYNSAIRVFPDYASVINDRAWMLATCPNESFRNGRKAVQDAEKAAAMSNYKAHNRLETLAAAHAENSNFEEAVKWQKRAIELAPKAIQQSLQGRLHLFQSQQPYREMPSARVD